MGIIEAFEHERNELISAPRRRRGLAPLAAVAAVAALTAACDVGQDEQTIQVDGGETTEIDRTYTIFDPANYAGYDGTGNTESTKAFQTAIDKASDFVAHNGTGLFVQPDLSRTDGTNVGPNAPQAIVRARPHSVFLLHNVIMKPNVRLEIDASSTLVPVHDDQQVIIQVLVPGDDSRYVDNITITSHGESATFEDRGRRCIAAGKSSPCALPKDVMYDNMKFPDGSGWASGPTALANRFVIDLDYRRYKDSVPPSPSGKGPRGSGIKLHQARNFLVENVLELAFPGIVLGPKDTPSGPGAIGSNTYPATAGNGLAIDAPPPGTTPDTTPTAVQPRNGTVRNMHCEGCTRGYGIIEIHAGVDIDYDHISTRGGIAVRWESRYNGQSTRQHATQVVGYDCNTPLLMSAHENDQVELEASYIKSIGCDNGFRSETTGGDQRRAKVSHLDIYGGTKAQVILCRFETCDEKYGSVKYRDDAWKFMKSESAIKNDTTGTISITNVRCTAPSTFSDGNSGFGSCSGL